MFTRPTATCISTHFLELNRDPRNGRGAVRSSLREAGEAEAIHAGPGLPVDSPQRL